MQLAHLVKLQCTVLPHCCTLPLVPFSYVTVAFLLVSRSHAVWFCLILLAEARICCASVKLVCREASDWYRRLTAKHKSL